MHQRVDLAPSHRDPADILVAVLVAVRRAIVACRGGRLA